ISVRGGVIGAEVGFGLDNPARRAAPAELAQQNVAQKPTRDLGSRSRVERRRQCSASHVPPVSPRFTFDQKDSPPPVSSSGSRAGGLGAGGGGGSGSALAMRCSGASRGSMRSRPTRSPRSPLPSPPAPRPLPPPPRPPRRPRPPRSPRSPRSGRSPSSARSRS